MFQRRLPALSLLMLAISPGLTGCSNDQESSPARSGPTMNQPDNNETGNTGPQDGSDGEDASALFQHFNQYTTTAE